MHSSDLLNLTSRSGGADSTQFKQESCRPSSVLPESIDPMTPLVVWPNSVWRSRRTPISSPALPTGSIALKDPRQDDRTRAPCRPARAVPRVSRVFATFRRPSESRSARVHSWNFRQTRQARMGRPFLRVDDQNQAGIQRESANPVAPSTLLSSVTRKASIFDSHVTEGPFLAAGGLTARPRRDP
jgi:hypothetical protein